MDSRVRCKVDHAKEVIVTNFRKRRWVIVDDDDDTWHFYWGTGSAARNTFNPEIGFRLADNQFINHFPNHFELTKKDLMVKNIKRYRKELAKEGRMAEYEASDFLPTTYTLPADYHLFIEEYKRRPATSWIVKPAGGSLGSGIFIMKKLSQLRKWKAQKQAAGSSVKWVVSQYIDNPLLIGGRKFDLRIYFLVLSYRPLRVYMHSMGFARFCTAKYDTEVLDPEDLMQHLTNVAIQKHGDEYNSAHGGKFSLQNLRLFVEGTHGRAAARKLFADIKAIAFHAFSAVKNVINSDRHCFECYGYDVLVDDTLKPWLVEVNASPSMSATTQTDRTVKHTVINDVINMVLPAGFPDLAACKLGVGSNLDAPMGGFELVVDELKDAARPGSASPRPPPSSAAASTRVRRARARSRTRGSTAGRPSSAAGTRTPRSRPASRTSSSRPASRRR
ncbi:tubulin-tyrosine ligase family protein [Thecamonas trahens ATCC 50062]|uniref:Tubulin-tyrosine ligase family protein n=1 Tax=Thecamonas trahens ATCC 50062 TaxID=461836 RepID=A0A0L0DFL0_THETB|nr:tubulin-tyrosine ligase family protein [Thecamonas trahens ATCC 50062]KNC50951.1 tubulin-tyrosine ligase family protein [Thecamonas trahens ATCC 50062]|eukprot:XP_013756647.1 tubulin-tyrosine ligase family protein [Thecamonas trahens ATCC 50062]